MANLSEETKWENGIYQLETDDPLQGGADGIDNVQAKQLANRTRYLKAKIENTQAEIAPVEASAESAHAYAIGEQFMYNDVLYTATAAIAEGDSIEVGTNCAVSDELVKQLANHKSNTSNPHNTTAAQVGAYSKAQTDSLLTANAFDTSALVDESKAVNLLDLLGIRAVHSDSPATQAESLQVIPKLKEWYAQHRFDGLKLCAYIDFASITVDGVTYTWNANYKNLRIMIMGFNTLLHCGDTEVVKPHIIFQFRNNVLEKRMNATDTNTGGYPASELREWLNDKFAAGLKAVLGDYLMEVPRLYSTKGSWGWYKDSTFIPTEPEVWGCPVWSEKTWNGFQGQWPAYREGTVYKVKTLNGSRRGWWVASPSSENPSCFCYCHDTGQATNHNAAGLAGGISPAICVALSDTQS